jgi:hypothetical protein
MKARIFSKNSPIITELKIKVIFVALIVLSVKHRGSGINFKSWQLLYCQLGMGQSNSGLHATQQFWWNGLAWTQ